MIYVNHPEHVDHITNRNADRYAAKPALLKEAVSDLPEFSYFSFTLDGEPWRQMRRLLKPTFSPKGLEEISGKMIREIEDQVNSWSRWADTGQYVDLQPELSMLTMSVFTSCFLSGSTERAVIEQSVESFDAMMLAFGWRILMGRAPSWVPRPHARKGRSAAAWIANYLDQEIAARRRTPVDTPDVLDVLLSARFSDGTALSDAQLRAELRGLIIAGYETTAAALSWTVALLTLDQESSDAAHAEVDRVTGQGIHYADLPKLTWLRACFDESQRLQGHPFNGREALEDDEIGGYLIPRGATVSFSAYALHRDPRFWREPDRFDPSRFETDEIDKHVFAPYSMGPHRCLGMHLANVVGTLTLAAALQRYRFEVPSGYLPKHKYKFGNPVKDGVPVMLHSR
jgi:cytochrome P450